MSENRLYFIKALNEAIAMKMQDEMADCNENAKTSIRHKLIMKQIVKGKCREHKHKACVIKRAVLIAVVAALLALTSCALAVIYFDEIAGFVEKTYDEFVWLTPKDKGADTEDYPQTIEKEFEFTYIPEGYELKTKRVKRFVAAYVYEDANGNEITLRQEIIDLTEFKFDGESGYTLAFSTEKTDVYCREDHVNMYVCRLNDYILHIHLNSEITDEELYKIIQGIE